MYIHSMKTVSNEHILCPAKPCQKERSLFLSFQEALYHCQEARAHLEVADLCTLQVPRWTGKREGTTGCREVRWKSCDQLLAGTEEERRNPYGCSVSTCEREEMKGQDKSIEYVSTIHDKPFEVCITIPPVINHAGLNNHS